MTGPKINFDRVLAADLSTKNLYFSPASVTMILLLLFMCFAVCSGERLLAGKV